MTKPKSQTISWPTNKSGVMGPAFWDKDYLPSIYPTHDDFAKEVLSPEQYEDYRQQVREWEAKHKNKP